MDSGDITHDMLKSIEEHVVVLKNNLHYQYCLQALRYNLPVLQLAPVSPKLKTIGVIASSCSMHSMLLFDIQVWGNIRV